MNEPQVVSRIEVVTDFFGAPVNEPVTDSMLDAALGTPAAHGLRPAGMSEEGYRMNMRRIVGEALTQRARDRFTEGRPNG